MEKDDLDNGRSKGLGDTIAKLTALAGIQPCGKCKERQQKLNKVFPYKQTEGECPSCGKKKINGSD